MLSREIDVSDNEYDPFGDRRIEILIEALKGEPDPASRRAAAKALARHKRSDVLAMLRNALSDPDPDVRLEALQALSSEWSSSDTGFISCLVDSHPPVRAEALKIFGDLSSFDLTPLVPKLVGMLRDTSSMVLQEVVLLLIRSPFPEASAAAWQALNEAPDSVRLHAIEGMLATESEQATAFLAASARSEDAQIAAAAVSAASAHGSPAATRILLEALGHDAADVRASAARSLANIEVDGVTEALITAWHKEQSKNSLIALAIVESLSERTGSLVDQVLIQALRHDDAAVAEAAVKALGKRPGSHITQALTRALPVFLKRMPSEEWTGDLSRFVNKSYLPNVPSRAPVLLHALSNREGPEVADSLIAALAHGDLNVRCGVTLCLHRHGGEVVLNALEGILKRDANPARLCAVYSLARQEDARAYRALVSELRGARAGIDDVLDAIIIALGTLPFETLGPILQEAYETGSSTVRLKILSITGHDEQQAASLLSLARVDANPEIRLAVLERASYYSYDNATVMATRKALDDWDPAVAGKASSRLARSSNRAAKRLLRCWINRVIREGIDQLTVGRLAAIDAAITYLEHNMRRGVELAALMVKCTAYPAFRDTAESIFQRLPQSWQAGTFPIVAETPFNEVDALAVIPNRSDVRILAALPMALAARKASPQTRLSAFARLDYLESWTEQSIAALFTSLIQLHGRPVLSLLRDLVAQSDVPETVRCGVSVALGLAGDQRSAAQFVELLGHPSQKIRSAATRALIELGDTASPDLTTAVTAGSPRVKIVGQYLRQILAGGEPASLPALVSRTMLNTGDLPVEDESHMNRMSFREHLVELLQRFTVAAAAMLVVGLLVWSLIGDRTVPIIAWLYNVSPATAMAYLPSGWRSALWFGIFAAAWCGWPLLIFQGWAYVVSGLYTAERTLALRPVLVAVGLGMSLPLLLPVIARLLAYAPKASPLLSDSLALIRATDIATVTLVLILLWILGFSRIWEWLTLRAESGFVSGIVTKQAAEQEQRDFNATRTMAFLAVGSALVFAAMPLPWIACSFLGAIVFLAFAGAFLGVAIDYARAEQVLGLFASVRSGIWVLLWPVPDILVVAPIIVVTLIAAPGLVESALLACQLDAAARLTPPAGGALDMNSAERLLLLTAWLALVLSNVTSLLRRVAASMIQGWDDVLAYYLFRLTGLGILIAPALLSDRGLSLSAAVLTGCGLTALAFFATSVIFGMPLRRGWLLLFAFIALACSWLPLPVLGGAVLWPVPIALACLPAAIDIHIRNPGLLTIAWHAISDASGPLRDTFDAQVRQM